MDRLIYLIKAPLPSGEYARAYAERVQPAETGFRAQNVAVPVAEPLDVGWAIHAHRLPDCDFAGFRYRVPAPSWFGSRTPAAEPAASGGCDWPPASHWDPPETLRRLAARHLHTTVLGNWCAHPEIRMALAQDRLAAALSPALPMPDFLAHEDELFRGWKEARPEAAASGLADAEAIAAAEGGAGSEARRVRQRLRLAALRRIDAAALGREVFEPCPWFFGEPYLPFAAPGGWTLKAGRVRTAHYWPAPENEARSRAARADRALIQAAERRLCPWLPTAGGAGDFARAWAAWRALSPLRDGERRSRYPLFPYRIQTVGNRPPDGYSVRIRESTLAEIGGTAHTLAAAGLCPFIADPFRDHCIREAELLETWAEDLPGSAAVKWAHCLS